MTLKDFFAKLDIIAVLGFLIAVETQISNGSMSFAHSLPEVWIPAVKEWAANLASLGGLLVGVIRMSGNSATAASTVVKVLIVAFLLSMFLGNGPAFAQTDRSIFDPLKALKQINDQLAAQKKVIDTLAQKQPTNVGQQISSDISNALNQFAEFVGADTTNAANLAISIPDTLDGNGQICWDAMTNASKVFQQNPVPTPDIATTLGVASTIERIRLLAMTANNVCQNTACTQVVADASGALSAAIPLKAPLPNLHDICSMIPTVAKAPPSRTLATTAPASAAGATPTPTPPVSPLPAVSPSPTLVPPAKP
jgi:hypothetical protein